MANRWLDRSQPQTLYFGNILLYVDAALGLLTLLGIGNFGLVGFGNAIYLWILVVVGEFVCGLGIANEKKVAYYPAIAVACLPVAIILYYIIRYSFPVSAVLITLLFDIALVCLLAHPQSRSYQRIWFK
jgi:hypothetical protein